MAEISVFNNESDINTFIAEFLEDHRNGNVLECAFVYRSPQQPGVENSDYKLTYHYYGSNSTVNILGLVEYLAMKVRDYLKEYDLGAEEDV